MSTNLDALLESPLLGEEPATVDGKGRVLFSKKKRDRLGETFVLALGLKGCLEALPLATWRGMVAEILAAPALNIGRQEYAGMLARFSDDGQFFDPEGRVVIPQNLRMAGHLELKDKVIVQGAIDRVRIWNVKEWEVYEADPEAYATERSSKMLKYYEIMKAATP